MESGPTEVLEGAPYLQPDVSLTKGLRANVKPRGGLSVPGLKSPLFRFLVFLPHQHQGSQALRLNLHVHTHTHTHTCAHMHVHVCMHTYTHAYVYTHARTHTHVAHTALSLTFPKLLHKPIGHIPGPTG